MISATLDTSVHIRAINFGGPASRLLGYAKSGDIRLDISDAIIAETLGVLREKFQLDGYTIHDWGVKLRTLCNVVKHADNPLSVIKEDPDDDRILECAVAAKSDFIVSEDKDLLRLGQYGNSRIVTIRDFMQQALANRRER